MDLRIIPTELSVCKVSDYSQIDITEPFVFTGSTDEEKSLVFIHISYSFNSLEVIDESTLKSRPNQSLRLITF